MDKKEQINPRNIEVQIPEGLRGGAYANLTNVSVTKNELVLNFIFVNDHDTPNGTLVSRVIVTREHAKDLVRLLGNAVSTAEELDPHK